MVAAAVYPIVAAVVAVQAVFRTDPDEAVAVLQATSVLYERPFSTLSLLTDNISAAVAG